MSSWRHSTQVAALLAGAFGVCDVSLARVPSPALQIVRTEHPSSYPPLLWVHVTNPAFTPVALQDWVTSSQIFIDGEVSKKTAAASFDGPAGLAPLSSWEGCFSLGDYLPVITPGKHKVSLKLGEVQSEEITVRWPKPVDWRGGTFETRLKEVRELGAALTKGLPRTCVEQWLQTKDDGMQEAGQVRYYVEPQIKVVVPYSSAGARGQIPEVVSGPVKVYEEPCLRDLGAGGASFPADLSQ